MTQLSGVTHASTALALLRHLWEGLWMGMKSRTSARGALLVEYCYSSESLILFSEILGKEKCARILNHGIDLDRSLVVEDDVVLVDESLSHWIQNMEAKFGEFSTLICKGNLTSNVHVAIKDHYLIVLGTLSCEVFSNHRDAGEYIGRLKADKFVSLASHNTDLIDLVESPHCFEWDHPVIQRYAPGTWVYFKSDAKEKGALAVVEPEDIEKVLPKSVLQQLGLAEEAWESNELFWSIQDDLDRFVMVLMECGEILQAVSER